MNIIDTIRAILADIMDLDPTGIHAQTYVIRDLGAESIDLLEIGVGIQHRFGIAVDDDRLFLKNLRLLLVRAEMHGLNPDALLSDEYPHLSEDRRQRLVADLSQGPVLRVADLEAYVRHALGESGAETCPAGW